MHKLFKRPAHSSRFPRWLYLGLSLILLLSINLTRPELARAVSIIEYPLLAGDVFPSDITSGPDGNIWFTQNRYSFYSGRIGRITPNGVITDYDTNLNGQGGYPTSITSGPDGNIWFTENSVYSFAGPNGRVDRITPNGIITEFDIPNPDPTGVVEVNSITNGPDGNLWFMEVVCQAHPFGGVMCSYSSIDKITPAGVVTQYAVSVAGSNDLTSGPDGNLWFIAGNNNIGKITPAGVITEYGIPTTNSYPQGITSGPDGNLWFTEANGNKIGKITPSGVATEYSLPTANSQPAGITSGPDGNLWFTEANGNKIGKITPAGGITEYGIPTANSYSLAIISGPDGNLWFTEGYGNKIGKLVLDKSKSKPPVLNPADIIAQLRVIPDRYASTDPSTEIRYTLTFKNVGPGSASSASIRFPIDLNLELGYATFSDPRLWVSAIVTDTANPYVQIALPTLESKSSSLSATLIFRPAAKATPGATISSRYTVLWDDEAGAGKKQLSNGVRLTLSTDNTNRNDSGGAIALLNPPALNLTPGSKVSLSGDFYIPDELINLWYTDKNGNSLSLGQQQADHAGLFSLEFVLDNNFKPGENYSIVGYGSRSEISGTCFLTILSS